jgi:hypothetical protein
VFVKPLLIPTSLAISETIKRQPSMIEVHTLWITSAFQLVDGLPERWSLSAYMQPFLSQLNHSLSWVTPTASLPRACWIVRIVSTWVSPSFWQNLMQYCCSRCSLTWSKTRMRRTRVTPLCYLAATEASGSVARQEKNHTCTWKSLLPLCSVSLPFRHYLPWGKI